MKKGIMKWKKDKIDYTYEGKFNANGEFENGGSSFVIQGNWLSNP